MNKWNDGRAITAETLLDVIGNVPGNADITEKTKKILSYIATTKKYPNRLYDLALMVEKLNDLKKEDNICTLKDVELILAEENWSFNSRELKVSFNKSGRGTLTPKITLPNTWLDILGVDTEHREIKITLTDDNKIIIEKVYPF